MKLSSLFSQFDPIDPGGTSRSVLARLRPILRMARQNGAMIHLDMEQFAYKELTVETFKSVFMEDEFRDWPDVGIAIQAYLRCTSDDLKGLAEWSGRRGTPVWVRLVKGAYWDFETVVAAQNGWPPPVFIDKAETDANFELAAAFLIENRHLLRPAIASHNVRSISAALACAERYEADPAEIEFQMLFGMADAIKIALVEKNHRVRVYAPVGRLLPGMAYLVRRLLENTSNESFLRAGFIDRVPEEQLLVNPLLRKRRPASVVRPAAAFTNEPPIDFSRESSCAGMERAIAAFSGQGRAEVPLLIAGQLAFSRINGSNRSIPRINPVWSPVAPPLPPNTPTRPSPPPRRPSPAGATCPRRIARVCSIAWRIFSGANRFSWRPSRSPNAPNPAQG